ncbi:hypothetical protein ACCC88_12565 [Sphingomonas sp. Sphisp140]|uniref:hypothetical protein n=1 Tax=unclassified Sphingomonas TaxID=196159 RepID=UPI0039B03933
MKDLLAALLLFGAPGVAWGQDAARISSPLGVITTIDDGAVSRVKVSVLDDGKVLEFRAVGPENVWVSYAIDVNADGKVDDRADLLFGADNEGGACAAYQLVIEEGATTPCGEFRTRGRYSEATEGGARTAIWRIPHGELARDGKRFGFTVLYAYPNANYAGSPFLYAFAGTGRSGS